MLNTYQKSCNHRWFREYLVKNGGVKKETAQADWCMAKSQTDRHFLAFLKDFLAFNGKQSFAIDPDLCDYRIISNCFH